MIQLTEQQRKAIDGGAVIRVVEDGHEYVLLRPDVYERLAEGSSDDGDWTAEELDRLRDEAANMLDNYGKSG